MKDFLYAVTPLQWLACVLVLFSLVTIVYGYRHYKSDRYMLRKVLSQYAEAYLENVVLFDGIDGYLFVDIILLLPGRIVVLQKNDSEGYVFGAAHIHEWTSVKDNVSRKFKNPLKTVGYIVTQIKHICDFESVNGYVLFGSQASFPKGVPDKSLHISMLADTLKELKNETPEVAAKKAWKKLVPLFEKEKF